MTPEEREELLGRVNRALANVTDEFTVHYDEPAGAIFVRRPLRVQPADKLAGVVRDVIAQDLFPMENCPDGPGCPGCLADALEGKRRLVAGLEEYDNQDAKP